MAGPEKPTSPTRDWRARAQPVGAPKTRKHVMRVLLTLGFLGLAAWFVWLLWPKTWPGVQLAVLPVTGYDIAFPPVPFSPADAAEFAAASPEGRAEILGELQDSENLQRLSDRLQRLVKSPKDVLILYINAHGVSEGGRPYVLCSDYFRDAPGSGAELKPTRPGDGSDPAAKGRMPLASVLAQVRECRAGLKLVLLDCNHIPANPRLGMVVNDFPRLLESLVGNVKETNDPSLWVLSCSGPLEVSRVSYAEKRSLFAHFVTQGFRGSADAHGDGAVDLAKFYAFVRDGVAGAIEPERAREQTQRPVLLHGGQGVVIDPPAHFLFRVRRSSDERGRKPRRRPRGTLPRRRSGPS